MEFITFAVCTYNRAPLLPELMKAMCEQVHSHECDYEILVVDNNSTDETEAVLDEIRRKCEKIRVVKETRQGISHARNRAIEESLGSECLLFIDDDEIPAENFVQAACTAFGKEQADCVGGRVMIRFPFDQRPGWFEEELLGFLAHTDYGDAPFWIKDKTTPLWTANIGYRTQIFRDDPELRFDDRYNREGKEVGGGEDVVMFNALIKRNMKSRYCPEMYVEHFVEENKVTRRYFIRRHFSSGFKFGRYEYPEYENSIYGVKPFMIHHFFSNTLKALGMYIARKDGALRQAMTASHSLGTIFGVIARKVN